MMKLPQFILGIFFFALISDTIQSQVTIGSNLEPVSGALLDLKENDTNGNSLINSTRGLILPRVKLTHIDNLYPMFENTSIAGTPNSEYNTQAKKLNQDDLHTGLIVFNMNECFPFGEGVYAWEKEKWTPINVSPSLPSAESVLASLPNVLHIPSGLDKRPLTSAVLSFNYNLSSNVKAIWSGPLSGINGGLSQLQISPDNPKEWNTDPAVLSVLAAAFTNANIQSNPWMTKESSIKISLPANICGGAYSKNITLNQTNYFMDLKDSGNRYPVSLVTIREPKVGKLMVNSNVPWQAQIVATDGALNQILTSYTQTVNGSTLSNNNKISLPFDFTGASESIGGLGKYATIRFSDTENRALDVDVTIVQCQGSQDLNQITRVVTPEETSSSGNPWGKDVVRHQGKPNVYNEFISADFGDAGRWMITNLAASSYDSGAIGLIGPSLAESNVSSFWSYPNVNGGDPTNPAYYNMHPEQGFLYNFPAATARLKNNSYEDERGISIAPIQGICPNGWHLPSDREWTILENEILKNTTKYAFVNKNIGGSIGFDIPEGYRGDHGAAMVNTCEAFSSGTQGLSRRLDEGGFNIIFSGYLLDGEIAEHKEAGVYWTSSTAAEKVTGSLLAYDRVFYYDSSQIANFEYTRAAYLSVRCIKNK